MPVPPSWLFDSGFLGYFVFFYSLRLRLLPHPFRFFDDSVSDSASAYTPSNGLNRLCMDRGSSSSSSSGPFFLLVFELFNPSFCGKRCRPFGNVGNGSFRNHLSRIWDFYFRGRGHQFGRDRLKRSLVYVWGHFALLLMTNFYFRYYIFELFLLLLLSNWLLSYFLRVIKLLLSFLRLLRLLIKLLFLPTRVLLVLVWSSILIEGFQLRLCHVSLIIDIHPHFNSPAHHLSSPAIEHILSGLLVRQHNVAFSIGLPSVVEVELDFRYSTRVFHTELD